MTRKWTEREDALLLEIVRHFGHKWRMVACAFNKKSEIGHRTTDSIRNRWNRIHMDLTCYEVMRDILHNMSDDENNAQWTNVTGSTEFSYDELISALHQYGTNNND
jgi:hypothetical protein